jgi:hypothetical protein
MGSYVVRSIWEGIGVSYYDGEPVKPASLTDCHTSQKMSEAHLKHHFGYSDESSRRRIWNKVVAGELRTYLYLVNLNEPRPSTWSSSQVKYVVRSRVNQPVCGEPESLDWWNNWNSSYFPRHQTAQKKPSFSIVPDSSNVGFVCFASNCENVLSFGYHGFAPFRLITRVSH